MEIGEKKRLNGRRVKEKDIDRAQNVGTNANIQSVKEKKE